jgi:hypothetical protein
VAARELCGRSSTGIAGSSPARAWMFVSCNCCVLSGRILCDELIPRLGESYQVCMCVIESDQVQE